MRGRTASRGEAGAAAVEMALLLPLLLLIIAGLIDFGRAFATQMMITQGSREGARMIAMGYSEADAATRATAGATGFGVSGDNTLTLSPGAACPATPNPATDASSYTVSVDFHFLILDSISGLFGGAIPSTSTFSATGSMPCLG